MKKGLSIGIVFLIVLAVLLTLPRQKEYTEHIIVNCTPTAATRIMSNPQQWKTWWPGEIKEDTVLLYKNTSFRVQTILLNGFYASTSSAIPASIDLQFLSAPNKQAEFIYSYTLYYSGNPFKKLVQYIQSNSIQVVLESFMQDIKTNLEDVKKVYGFEIVEERVPNSLHVSTKKTFNRKPTTDEIYELIDELNLYIQSNQAKAVNTPIYNVFTADDANYQLMVAIATDRPLPAKGNISYKEMVRGKIIIGKAIGPNNTVDQCLKQVEYFVKDHGRSSPAIQFNRLITDRRQERDSSKWITTVNYPVFDRSFF